MCWLHRQTEGCVGYTGRQKGVLVTQADRRMCWLHRQTEGCVGYTGRQKDVLVTQADKLILMLL